MFAVTNTTLDLLVLELVLHSLGVGILALVLGILAPVHAGSENDVLSDGCRISGRAIAILGAGTELCPLLSFSDAGVHGLLVCDVSDSTGSLDFLVVLIVTEGNDSLCSILV